MRSHFLQPPQPARVLRLHTRSARLLAPSPQRAKKPRRNTTRQRLFLNDRRRAQPSAGFTSHNTTFTQPSCCGFCPSQNTSAQSPNVFLAQSGSDGAEDNDIFSDRPRLSKMQCFWQMSQSTITKYQDTPSERRSSERCSFPSFFCKGGKTTGEYQVLPVISSTSLLSKHLHTRTHMRGRECVWRAYGAKIIRK